MNSANPVIQAEARQQIAERVARASAPHLPHVPPRRRFARHLRRFADRIEN